MTELEKLGLEWANGKITLSEMLQAAYDAGRYDAMHEPMSNAEAEMVALYTEEADRHGY